VKTESPGRSSGNGVQSVRRIAALLNALRDSRCGLNVSEISRRTGIHKSTTSRLLASMLHEKLVDHDEETRLYRLGTGIVAMAAGVEPDMFLRHAARPYLARVNEATGETATLSIFDDYQVLTIDEIAGPSTLRFVAWTGMRTPLHASASGKCLLAFSAPEILEHYLTNFELHSRTQRTITRRSE
jgi:DNA-binding IclR family transcriptional regulator